MLLTSRNSTYRTGVFVDNVKVRESHITYLKAIDELTKSQPDQVTSLMIVKFLNRSTSALETIKKLESLGFIYDSEDGRMNEAGKNWVLTDLGEQIINFAP
jgi:hypothetical protein